jgi:hypothetical protein
MQEKHHRDNTNVDEHGHSMNPFSELLKVCDVELLIRFRHRLKKVGKKRMVEILSEEIEEREALEREEAKARKLSNE